MEKVLSHDLKIISLMIFDDLYWLCVCVCVCVCVYAVVILMVVCVCVCTPQWLCVRVSMHWCKWPLVQHALTHADVCGRMRTYADVDGGRWKKRRP